MSRRNIRVGIDGDLEETDHRYTVTQSMRTLKRRWDEHGDTFPASWDGVSDRVRVRGPGGINFAFSIDDLVITDVIKPKNPDRDELRRGQIFDEGG